jgi:hypothetical protein
MDSAKGGKETQVDCVEGRFFRNSAAAVTGPEIDALQQLRPIASNVLLR